MRYQLAYLRCQTKPKNMMNIQVTKYQPSFDFHSIK